MKKTALLIAVLSLIVIVFSGCDTTTSTDPTSSESQQTTSSSNPTTPSNLPKYVDGSIKLASKDEMILTFPFEMHYRWVYYEIDGYYTKLVPNKEQNEFMRRYWEADENEEPPEMMLAAMVQHFNIPREEFDKATEKLIAACIGLEQDMTSELYEIPNGDIIYTFDNAIINEYYRRK